MLICFVSYLNTIFSGTFAEVSKTIKRLLVVILSGAKNDFNYQYLLIATAYKSPWQTRVEWLAPDSLAITA
jgi:hypothetical protein